MKLVASNGTDVTGGSTTVNTSAAPTNQFAYGALSSTVTLSANDDSRRVLDFVDASHWRVESLKVRGSRHANIKIDGGTDIVIRKCTVYDATKKGIIANGDLITIEDSTIRDIRQPVGGEDTQGIAVWRGSRIRIRRNTITTPGDGVLLSRLDVHATAPATTRRGLGARSSQIRLTSSRRDTAPSMCNRWPLRIATNTRASATKSIRET